ncbi:hypothetical protein MLP_04630 [Microlunatus phosphovorus NM-1]|uniref:HD/PDEase domain-containing protein n=1 Tax=Microlunatus phosphovorus (strain ATCC 700054 / DSM 10555 / JCM 9379 / NBRC 101784 / NCIMB 13414 / VKM Ac-1990 / NM-1) TaxID=1032480 RepID=F5XJY1_MICPN|nr:HD domain-containing protein [Microlunatus phosphovorus]BAK33477.1 hypothetical protein MLP_04630 [Microlunatus phosphovorus NM-1]
MAEGRGSELGDALLDPVPVGDRPIARAALTQLDQAPAEIRTHSRRMVLLARGLAGDRPVDQALLVAACALHDLGLLADASHRWSRLGFPDRSAALLAELGDEYEIGRDRADPWCWAVARHLRPRGGADETLEAGLLRRAAWLDAVGIGSRTDRTVARGLRFPHSAPESLRLLLRVGGGCLRDLVR